MNDEGTLTLDFTWSGNVVTVSSCCAEPSPRVGSEVTTDPRDLQLQPGERAWWLGCSNCAKDIAVVVWTPPRALEGE